MNTSDFDFKAKLALVIVVFTFFLMLIIVGCADLKPNSIVIGQTGPSPDTVITGPPSPVTEPIAVELVAAEAVAEPQADWSTPAIGGAVLIWALVVVTWMWKRDMPKKSDRYD